MFALQATLDYAEACKAASNTTYTCYAVQEHEEPLEFVHCFTAWNETCQNVLAREAVLTQANIAFALPYKSGKVLRPNVQQVKSVKDELDRLQTKTYSLERLRQVPLPEGVDGIYYWYLFTYY